MVSQWYNACEISLHQSGAEEWVDTAISTRNQSGWPKDPHRRPSKSDYLNKYSYLVLFWDRYLFTYCSITSPHPSIERESSCFSTCLYYKLLYCIMPLSTKESFCIPTCANLKHVKPTCIPFDRNCSFYQLVRIVDRSRVLESLVNYLLRRGFIQPCTLYYILQYMLKM